MSQAKEVVFDRFACFTKTWKVEDINLNKRGATKVLGELTKLFCDALKSKTLKVKNYSVVCPAVHFHALGVVIQLYASVGGKQMREWM